MNEPQDADNHRSLPRLALMLMMDEVRMMMKCVDEE
jgi:hypothetical protein